MNVQKSQSMNGIVTILTRFSLVPDGKCVAQTRVSTLCTPMKGAMKVHLQKRGNDESTIMVDKRKFDDVWLQNFKFQFLQPRNVWLPSPIQSLGVQYCTVIVLGKIHSG